MANIESWTIETYISSSWVDLTDDVILPFEFTRGIKQSSVVKRIADVGTLSFSLNNGENNSVATLGYYTPGHDDSLSGWDVGLRVRLYYVHDSVIRYKFYGRIKQDGIKIDAGTSGNRRVYVTVEDYIASLRDTKLSLLEYQTNKTADEVVPLILAGLPEPPLETDYSVGSVTFPTVFDTVQSETTAIGELQKIIMSEWTHAYIKGDRTGGETFVLESRDDRVGANDTEIGVSSAESGYELREDGGNCLLEDGYIGLRNEKENAEFDNCFLSAKIGYGEGIINKVETNSYPRRVDDAATTVLAELQEPFKIEAKKSKEDFRLSYRDPDGVAKSVVGIDMVTPESGVDYIANSAKDGSGSDLTDQLEITHDYGVQAVNYDLLENIGTSDLWVTTLQARGRGVYHDDSVTFLYKDQNSIDEHREKLKKLDFKYIADPTISESIGVLVVEKNSTPKLRLETCTINANKNGSMLVSFLDLEPGTRATFKETLGNINEPYYIQGYKTQHLPNDIIMWSPFVRPSSLELDDVARWGTGEWGNSSWSY